MTKDQLRFYITEDAKANKCDLSQKNIILEFLMYRSEKTLVFRYLKCLRLAEYYDDHKTFWGKLLKYHYAMKASRLGTRYSICIPKNKCGYGLKINHLSGGGGHLFKC